jgi:hypothetical protein
VHLVVADPVEVEAKAYQDANLRLLANSDQIRSGPRYDAETRSLKQ